MLKLIIIFLLLATPAWARLPIPDIPGNSADDNHNGDVDEAPATAITEDPSNAGQYQFHFKDCDKTVFVNVADAGFVDSTRVEKVAGTSFLHGEIMCAGTLAAGTYEVHIDYASPAGARGVWLATSPIGNTPDNSTAMVLPETSTRQWAQVVQTGSNENFVAGSNGGADLSFVHGGGQFLLFVKAESDVRLGCVYLTTSDTPSLSCPGESGGGLPNGSPPVVTNPAIPAETVEQHSFVMTADTNVDGSCRVHWGFSSENYTISGFAAESVNGKCVASAGNLQAGTLYFAEMRVTNVDGTGDSTEVQVTTKTDQPLAVCDYVAGPTEQGAKDGSDDANRFLIRAFWPLAQPGTTLCLADGTYTGDDSMIVPPSGLNGNSLAPIKIMAINDGQVLIDGQGVRRTAVFLDNDWFVIEGINLRKSSVDVMRFWPPSANNIARRVVGWDAPANINHHIFSTGGTNNWFIDAAGFGTARKIFSFQGSTNSGCRRCFGIWERSSGSGPKMVYTNGYNSFGTIVENSIGMWNQTANPTEPYGIFAQDKMEISIAGSYCSNTKYLGGIGIYRSGHTVSTSTLGSAFGSRSVDCTEFKDLVLYVDPGSHTTLRAMQMQKFDGGSAGVASCAPNCDREINDITEVGWSVTDSINTSTDGWAVTNKQAYASIAAMDSAGANPFQATSGTGARVCKTFVNGALTTEGLFTSDGKWRMGDRVNSAMATAELNPDDFFGAGNELGGYLASVFGAIPAECRE